MMPASAVRVAARTIRTRATSGGCLTAPGSTSCSRTRLRRGAPMRRPTRVTQRRRDRLYQWTPPFDASSKKVLLESDNRMSAILFTEDAKAVFVAENPTGTGHVYAHYFDEPGKNYTIWRVRGLNASVGGGQGGFG